MSNDEAPRSELWSSGWLLIAIFSGLGLLWLMFLSHIVANVEPDGLVIGVVTTSLFTGGMVAIAAALARWRSVGLPAAFAWRRCSRRLVLASLLAGAVIAPLVSVLASFLAARSENLDPSRLEAMERLLLDGPTFGRMMVLAVVLLVAPLFEEMIFRGFAWHAIESSSSPLVAWLLTSLLFVGYHGDPLHIAALLPLSLVLGWLRMVSNSLWPSLAAHFGHNLCAVVVLLCLGEAA